MESSPVSSDIARRLLEGAREELDLTPKPGLVDRSDSGSHPDLSYASMLGSVRLMEIYFDELGALARSGSPLERAAAAGRRAEERMIARVGSNAHRGFLFLGGLVLLASWRARPGEASLRDQIVLLARAHFDRASEGLGARDGHSGIRGEALAGLPSVFETGLPAFRDRLAERGDRMIAAFLMMARLMQVVDDTTALRRCGERGLLRLRADGARIERAIAREEDPRPLLRSMNTHYRRIGLTMGGVADCMGIVFALSRRPAPLAPASPSPGGKGQFQLLRSEAGG
jgi:triphosphoribosyl-dephospho-CoA synthase